MPAYEQTLQLVDAEQRKLGEVRIDSKVEQLLIGEFSPGPGFSAVEELFQQFEEAVAVQALGIVDKLDRQIAALGLQLYALDWKQAMLIQDVQIWRDGGFSCRLNPMTAPSVNGISHFVNDDGLAKTRAVTQPVRAH